MGSWTEVYRKSGEEITLEEFQEWVAGDAELELSDPLNASFTGAHGIVQVLNWSEGRVIIWKCTEEGLNKLCQLADAMCHCLVVHELGSPDEPEYESGAWVEPEPTTTEVKQLKYSPRTRFEEGYRVEHPKFGLGVVLKAEARKIKVDFAGEIKMLAHGL